MYIVVLALYPRRCAPLFQMPPGGGSIMNTLRKRQLVQIFVAALSIFLSFSSAGAAKQTDLEILLKATPAEQVTVGAKLDYTFTVENLGPSAAPEVVVTGHLSAKATLVSASSGCTLTGRTITCKASSLADGAHKSWDVAVKPSAVGTIANSASVSCSIKDPKPGNNKATVSTKVVKANRPPVASNVSITADPSNPYVQKQLIAKDPDGDTVTYELIAPKSGKGYSFAYLNPRSGMLYVTLKPGYSGTIVLQYHATDGKVFGNAADATITVKKPVVTHTTGNKTIAPKTYASFPRGYYDGNLEGAPNKPPTLPSSVDLSANFPEPGDQGQQESCVGWASAYALKTYDERIALKWSLEPAEHKFSPAYVYNQINGGKDSGSNISDALSLFVSQGCASLATDPYSDTDYTTQPSAAARKEASAYKAIDWKTLNGTDEIKAVLANNLPVVCGIAVFDSFQNLSGPGSVYNTYTGNLDGGHAVTIVGYDDNKFGGAFRIINSWGTSWGDNGFFWLPYSDINQTVQGTPVFREAYSLHDKTPTKPAPVDPVNPPPPAKLPDLQVQSWQANWDPTNPSPGTSGTLQYTVVNSGNATAPEGVTVALVLSPTSTFNAGTAVYVVEEQIPFAMDPGITAYRHKNNELEFQFPGQLEPGTYYMALWVDPLGYVQESNKSNNISPATDPITIVDTLPDLTVDTWYASWDDNGNGDLTYEVSNIGVSDAPAGFSINLVLSSTGNIGDGNDIYLYTETMTEDLPVSEYFYRNSSNPGYFNLLTDVNNDAVPSGTYYMALSVNPDHSIKESDYDNNTSLAWGTVDIGNTGSKRVSATGHDALNPAEGVKLQGRAYNGMTLPSGSMTLQKVEISSTPEGGRQVKMLKDSGPLRTVRSRDAHIFRKIVESRQKVVFPSNKAIPMPSNGDTAGVK